MRFSGTIKTWNDERGFGFITSAQGGQDIFVHIKAFNARSGRPQAGQAVTFEVELNRDGKKRARAVELPRATAGRTHRHGGAAQWGGATCFLIPAFFALYVAASVLWHVPTWVGGIYIGASLIAFVIYATDKSAAIAGAWRVSEATLLSIGLFGGWPGAIVAQQILLPQIEQAEFPRGVLEHGRAQRRRIRSLHITARQATAAGLNTCQVSPLCRIARGGPTTDDDARVFARRDAKQVKRAERALTTKPQWEKSASRGRKRPRHAL